MKTVSYIIDLVVFFTLLIVFDVNWIVAFIISEIVGWSIRAMFVKEEAKQQEGAVPATSEK